QLDKIANQYRAFAGSIGAEFDDTAFRQNAEATAERVRQDFGSLSIAVGEMLNANSFELALALIKAGHRVPEIYTNISSEDYVYIRRLAELSPETKVYTNLSPTMLYYDCGSSPVDLTIGKDAVYYHPDQPNVPWNSDRQPFGYAGVEKLYREMREALEGEER
ncbi:MAG: oxidoreductase, partial [Mogibacterium sp.]|nr:oxidoreductase [Mogibacterium sp.]